MGDALGGHLFCNICVDRFQSGALMCWLWLTSGASRAVGRGRLQPGRWERLRCPLEGPWQVTWPRGRCVQPEVQSFRGVVWPFNPGVVA